jgi:oligopeptide transport system substrate-binding protein
MKYRKRIAALGLAALMTAALFGCGAPKEGITLRAVLSAQSVESLDPAYLTTTAEQIMVNHLYENLMKAGDNGTGGVTALAGQAKSYETIDNGDETVTYRFTLRDGLTWSDGQAVTAQNFVYAWQRLVDPKTASPHAEILNMVAGYEQARSRNDLSYLQVSADGDRVFCVTLAYDCPYFLKSVCTSPYTMPMRQDLVDSGVQAMVTNGVYQMVKQDDTGITMTERSDYYDTKRTGPAELQFTMTADVAGAWELYRSNQADFILGLPEEEIASQAKDEYWKADPAASTYAIFFNQMSMGVANGNLRRALALCVDYAAVGEIVNPVSYPAATGLVPVGITNYYDNSDFRAAGDTVDTNRENYEKNCETATTLMQGIDLSALGEIQYAYEQTDTNQALAELLQKTWREKLNLSVTLRPLSAQELDTAVNRGEFIMAGMTITADRDDATAFLDHWASGATGNIARFSDNAYDLLIDVSRVSNSAEARSAYLEDAEALLLDKNVVLPLYFNTRTWEMRADLTGLFRDSLGNYYFTAVRKAAK